jgi:uncharacterized membrane protein YvbJ
MITKKLKLIGAGISIILLALSYWFVYKAGVNSCKVEQSETRDKAIETDRAKVKTVIEYKDKLKVVYRDKIKYIERVQDKTGCADVKLVDMGFGLQ